MKQATQPRTEAKLWLANRGKLAPVEIVAYESGVPGLVIHRPLGSAQVATDWVVSHEASGSTVLEHIYPDFSTALQAAEALAGLTDWTQSKEAIRKAVRVTQVIDAVGHLAEEVEES